MSLAILIVSMIPFVNLLFCVWWLAAGWGAVVLYNRLTGQEVTVAAGARLGWITGVLTFVSLSVVISLGAVFGGKQAFQDLMSQNPEIARALTNAPAIIVISVVFVLFVVFLLVVGVCAAGGALGAKFAARNSAH